jgi:hypothetical protein
MSAYSPRDWRLYADDILEACGRIRRAVAGATLKATHELRAATAGLS